MPLRNRRSRQQSRTRRRRYYWASRALVRCRQPEKVSNLLRAAARNTDTLYGMMAAEALGLRNATPAATPDFSASDWQSLRDVNNVRLAVQLAEIGADGLADDVLRYQARIGAPSQYAPLSRLARDLGLPSTSSGWPTSAARRPRRQAAASPRPVGPGQWLESRSGATVCPFVAESNFRTAVTSPAGAKGLMQVLPGTARDMARADPVMQGRDSQLDLPDVNLAFGQTYLTRLRDNGATEGLLPKVIAAYNAGPMPVARWNVQVKDQGDPLLWMGSIPYWETRGYVAAVMRNYWMYERQAGGPRKAGSGWSRGCGPSSPDFRARTTCGLRWAAIERIRHAWLSTRPHVQADQHRPAHRFRHARTG
jgi:hypothetical protein